MYVLALSKFSMKFDAWDQFLCRTFCLIISAYVFWIKTFHNDFFVKFGTAFEHELLENITHNNPPLLLRCGTYEHDDQNEILKALDLFLK